MSVSTLTMPGPAGVGMQPGFAMYELRPRIAPRAGNRALRSEDTHAAALWTVVLRASEQDGAGRRRVPEIGWIKLLAMFAGWKSTRESRFSGK